MEGGADVEGDVLDVIEVEQWLGREDILAQASQHKLWGRVEVSHVDAFEVVFPQDLLHRGFMAIQDRRHGPARGLAHELAPLLHQSHPGGKVKHAGSKQRIVFTQAVPGHVIRFDLVLPELVEIVQGIDHEQGRLCVAGVSELLVGAVEAQLFDRVAENGVCLCGELGECLE